MGSKFLLSILARKIGARLEGPDAEVSGIAGVDEAGPGQVAPVGDQGRAGAVLQAAVTLFDHIEHEHIAAKRRFAPAMPEANLLGADAPGIGQQAIAVKTRPGAGHAHVR